MNKVITVSLNGNAYQMDEDGYNTLAAYLSRAETKLRGSADHREVIADLERSIADKCANFLRPHKNVVSGAEITQILNEMGPVQTPEVGSIESEPSKAEAPPLRSETVIGGSSRRRRLYRIREGSKWAGVCTGMAAFTDMDVSIIRVMFVLATFCAAFFGLLVYIVLIFVLPVAYTESEVAAAHSRPPELRHT